MAQYRHLDVKTVGVVTVASFRDERILDDMVIQQLGVELDRLASSRDCDNLLLDFSRVSFVSSSALRVLMVLNKKVKVGGGKLKLCTMQKKVQELFSMTGLDRLFKIYPGQTRALQAFYD